MTRPSVMRALPPEIPGRRIGLLGGSFNPAHEGHLHISELALKRLRLDEVWWLVSPGNPLKDPAELAQEARRLESARQAVRDPRLRVSDAEGRLGTRYTVDTLRALTSARPLTRFVWLMGADNLIQLPRWQGWRQIMSMVPVAVFGRPGYTIRAGLGLAANAYRAYRLDTEDARLLALMKPPAWVMIPGPLHPLSATALRRAGQGL